MLRSILFATLALFTVACGTDSYRSDRSPAPKIPQPDNDNLVIVATASFPVTVTNGVYASSANTAVTVALAASSTFAISTASFVPPTLDNAVMSFGSIAVSTLTTNDLKVCGSSPKVKCTKAYIRIYTTATGAGFWNATDAYSAPMSAGLSGSLLTVGLTSTNATTVQSFTIPGTRNSLKLADFPSPTYLFSGDFTDAGVGSYSTTINIDLALGT
jgi:hypothetical protein